VTSASGVREYVHRLDLDRVYMGTRPYRAAHWRAASAIAAVGGARDEQARLTGGLTTQAGVARAPAHRSALAADRLQVELALERRRGRVARRQRSLKVYSRSHDVPSDSNARRRT